MKNSEILLYHGSLHIENTPQFDQFIGYFGPRKSFVASPSEEYSKQACSRFNVDFVLANYSFKTEGLTTVNLFLKQYSLLNLVATILKYRLTYFEGTKENENFAYLVDNFSLNLDDIDWLVCPRIDNSNFDIILSFLKNTMSYQTMKKNLEISEKDPAIVLVSEKALSNLTLIKNEIVEARGYYKKYLSHDLKIRTKLKIDLKQAYADKNSIYLKDIKEMEIKQNDPCL